MVRFAGFSGLTDGSCKFDFVIPSNPKPLFPPPDRIGWRDWHAAEGATGDERAGLFRLRLDQIIDPGHALVKLPRRSTGASWRQSSGRLTRHPPLLQLSVRIAHFASRARRRLARPPPRGSRTPSGPRLTTDGNF